MMDQNRTINQQPQKTRWQIMVMAMFFCLASTTAFTQQPLIRDSALHISTKGFTENPSATTKQRSRTVTSALQAKSQQPTADFEYQELQIQMDAMKEQNVKPSQLDPAKRNELKGYVEEILSRRLTNKKSVDSSVPLEVRLRSSLPGTKWRMAFTTQSLMNEALPQDATITLNFASGSGSAATGSNKVDYGLDFFQTLALKKLTAKSTYSVLEPQPNMPGTAIVEIKYEKVVTDVMGFSNVGIGLFGMLKGRSTYIPTVFFDDNLWIERGVDQSNFGEAYYNVYARDKDGDDWQKR